MSDADVMASNQNSQKALKWISLITLTFQNAVLSLSMRYARTQTGKLFISSTAVVMSEVVKLLTCLIIVAVDEKGIGKGMKLIHAQIFKQPMDTLKVSVPSLIYTLQNNLIFVAASNLDAATYQVTYQLKILTTAMFSVIMLKKSLGALQWVALVFLLSGVGLVQVAQSGATAGRTGGHDQNKLLGFVAVIVSCCMSGFAGVYFEKILKGSDVSVWMRNIQLSFLSIPFSLITTFVNDGHQVREEGFFVSYNGVVWFVVFMYALGGLVVAAVVKYADNILKGFATSLAIVIACVASIYMFDFNVTYLFVLGTSLVIVSIFMYGHPSAAAVQAGVRSPGKGILMKV